jgi:hypothetical protein
LFEDCAVSHSPEVSRRAKASQMKSWMFFLKQPHERTFSVVGCLTRQIWCI